MNEIRAGPGAGPVGPRSLAADSLPFSPAHTGGAAEPLGESVTSSQQWQSVEALRVLLYLSLTSRSFPAMVTSPGGSDGSATR